MVISSAEASTCANTIYPMVISSAEASTCVLYYVVTPTAAALKQDLLNYYSYCDEYELSCYELGCELIFRLSCSTCWALKICALNYLESLLKIDLSYIHFDFQVAHLMDSKPIEVIVDTNVYLFSHPRDEIFKFKLSCCDRQTK
jgi:hypothetical protein